MNPDEAGRGEAHHIAGFFQSHWLLFILLGGLLIAAGDTAGNPSVAWRSRHAANTVKREAALTAKSVQAASAKAEAQAAKAAAKTSAKAAKVAAKGGVKAGKTSGKAGAAVGNTVGKLTALLPG